MKLAKHARMFPFFVWFCLRTRGDGIRPTHSNADLRTTTTNNKQTPLLLQPRVGGGNHLVVFFFFLLRRPADFFCLFVCLFFSGQQAARIDEVAGAALELVRRPALDEQPALLVEDGGQLASQRGAHQPLRGHQILSTEKQRKQTKNRTVQENTSSFERKKGTRNEKRPSVGQRRERKGQ